MMWFSGLRGAIAFALSLEFNSEMDTPGTRVIESSTLVRGLANFVALVLAFDSLSVDWFLLYS